MSVYSRFLEIPCDQGGILEKTEEQVMSDSNTNEYKLEKRLKQSTQYTPVT